MSISASIDFKLHQKHDALTNLDIIELLFKHDWTFNDYGLKRFVPLGAEIGDFDFINISDDELRHILKLKQNSDENLSVVMTWKSTNIGFTFLTHHHLEFSLILDVNRQTTTYNVTDFMWYLDKIIPFLDRYLFSIIEFNCNEIR